MGWAGEVSPKLLWPGVTGWLLRGSCTIAARFGGQNVGPEQGAESTQLTGALPPSIGIEQRASSPSTGREADQRATPMRCWVCVGEPQRTCAYTNCWVCFDQIYVRMVCEDGLQRASISHCYPNPSPRHCWSRASNITRALKRKRHWRCQNSPGKNSPPGVAQAGLHARCQWTVAQRCEQASPQALAARR
jgi:hypothetical protein